MVVAGKGRGRGDRGLRAEETTLWESFVRAIKPLRRGSRPAPAAMAQPDRESTKAAPSPAKPAAPRREAVPAAIPPLAPLDRRLRQRIARGTHDIDARLDLHGLTQARAHAALVRFLRSAQADGAKLVLVITGKGARADDTDGRGVLRRQVPLWLAQEEFRPYVVGFEGAHTGHGGEGALYIRVRRRRA